jgi:hypothetical protein
MKGNIMNLSKGFDKTNLKVLREELNKVLREAGMNELKFDVGNAQFSSAEVTFKLNIKIKGQKTKNDIFLDQEIKALGLIKEKNGARLVEYKASNWKYPFIYEKDGKRWKCGMDQAKFLFSAA